MAHIHLTLDTEGILSATLDVQGRTVNTLSNAVLDELEALVARAREESGIRGIILQSAKAGNFAAGGDLDELANLMKPSNAIDAEMISRDLVTASRPSRVLRQLETCGKPVVSIVAGTALGGGLELALATHYRIAVVEGAIRFGLPEVTMGLIPGAGGTQRLPRLIGIAAALPLLLEGKPIDADRALKLGLIDAVTAAHDATDAARAWLLGEAATATQPWDRKGFAIPRGGPYAAAVAPALTSAVAKVRGTSNGNSSAQILILECVYEGCLIRMDAALRFESKMFLRALRSPVARAMVRTSFHSLRRLRKGEARPSAIDPAPAKLVGVIGAGMMGSGIARVSAQAGIDVILLDQTLEAAQAGRSAIERDLAADVERGRLLAEAAAALLNRIIVTDSYAALDQADLIVEAVYEDRTIKTSVLAKLDAVVRGATVLASNTSTLSITSLASASKLANRVIGLHFFSPVHRMDLVEVIRGRETDDRTLAKALDFVLQLRKVPIVVNDGPGFYTSRVFQSYLLEGAEMLMEGYAPALIDNLGRSCGMPRGPLELSDDVGLDLALAIRRQAAADQGESFVPVAQDHVLKVMVDDHGRTGRKGGAGFYEYPGGRAKIIWPGLADHFPVRHGDPSAEAIQALRDRLLFRQVVETFRAMADGIVVRARDADVGAVLGWGFPAWTGGPVSFAQQYGLAAFVSRCERLAPGSDRFLLQGWVRDKAEQVVRSYEE